MNVSSKLRQLIEQVFEIMLSEHHEFKVQQIVWARVQQYPAWPAKIVRKLNQHGKTVYKLNFFGDPSYCHLHSDSLTSFSQYNMVEEIQLEHNLKLKRAFELAKFYSSKQIENISLPNTQCCNLLSEVLHPLAIFGQTKIQSKEIINLPQKMQQLQIQNTIVTNLNCYTFPSICCQNVIEIFQSYQKAKTSSLLENLKRKQIICFQNDLKQNLLLKYKLDAVQFLKQTSISNQLQSDLLKQKRIIKKQKKKCLSPQFQLKERSMRKIYRILIQKGINRHMASNVTMKIIDYMENISQPLKIKGSLNFKQNIIKILQQISLKIKQLQQVELEYLQKQILSLIQIEAIPSHKLQESLSRTTQMCQQFII